MSATEPRCVHSNLRVDVGQTIKTYCADCGAPLATTTKPSLRLIEGGKNA